MGLECAVRRDMGWLSLELREQCCVASHVESGNDKGREYLRKRRVKVRSGEIDKEVDGKSPQHSVCRSSQGSLSLSFQSVISKIVINRVLDKTT